MGVVDKKHVNNLRNVYLATFRKQNYLSSRLEQKHNLTTTHPKITNKFTAKYNVIIIKNINRNTESKTLIKHNLKSQQLENVKS